MVNNKVLPISRRDQILTMLEAKGTVRITQIANDLGVSPITIRRDIALLAEEGKLQQIRGGARSLNPEPTRPISSNATIGVLTPSLDFYWPSIIDGANSSADAAGIRLMLQASTFDAEDNIRQINRLLDAEHVNGLFVVPDIEGPRSPELIKLLCDIDMPLVLVEREIDPKLTDGKIFESVTADHERGGKLAVRHLTDLGHHKIALVTDKLIPSRHAIKTGWAEALTERGLDHSDLHLDTTELTGPERTERLVKFLETSVKQHVTAFLIHSDEAAVLALDVLQSRGHRVPEDVSVVAYDDELARLARPALTAISPPKPELGACAIELLVNRFANPAAAERQVRLQPQLIIRDSTAAPGKP